MTSLSLGPTIGDDDAIIQQRHMDGDMNIINYASRHTNDLICFTIAPFIDSFILDYIFISLPPP